MAYFNLVDRSRATVIGGFSAANAGQIQTGVLVRASATRTLTLCTAALRPDGFAEGLRQLVYAPTALTLDAGEYCNIVNGKVLVRCDSTFFTGGTLPSAGDVIYTAASGLMTTTGSQMLGKCLKAGTDDDTYRVAPNTTANVVLLDLELGGKENVEPPSGGG